MGAYDGIKPYITYDELPRSQKRRIDKALQDGNVMKFGREIAAMRIQGSSYPDIAAEMERKHGTRLQFHGKVAWSPSVANKILIGYVQRVEKQEAKRVARENEE